jgi:hypothetical protein
VVRIVLFCQGDACEFSTSGDAGAGDDFRERLSV